MLVIALVGLLTVEITDQTDWADSVRRLPELAEVMRLPDVPEISEAKRLNGVFVAHLRWLEGHAPPWDLDSIAAARCEAHRLAYLWSLIERARDDSEQRLGPDQYRPTAIERRQALAELRREIGDAAYITGSFPPAFPWWRLPRR